MLERLKASEKVVGTRTTLKAIEQGRCEHAFIAEDADVFITRRVQEACQKMDVEYTRVDTMKMLGEACGVQVPTACCAVLKNAK